MAIKKYVCFYDSKALLSDDFDDNNPYRAVDDKPRIHVGRCPFFAGTYELEVSSRTNIRCILEVLKPILKKSGMGYKNINEISLKSGNREQSYKATSSNSVELNLVDSIHVSCTKY